ncbi:MAG: 2-succinyl-5-enolpyruvyl-6-hydroxy-3-cyclohexene-1-carboxylic-acid synthase [Bacteroidales bacterium]|nr:2-succinyl-5-enolpyruvyl-6-hydroxy-3-cyclohexene-1-carboxylic-acid synthase [Candidatus Physcousia equi]
MISNKRPIQQLTRLLLAHGIEQAVLCPGSRNAPINYSLSQHLNCHAITDERCAGFFALGLSRSTHKPVCVVVTSGSALVNLHPAVCEAYYQQVPLIVVSADRPRQWIGQMDGQTMPQPGVFGSMVKCSVDLDEQNAPFNNRLINEALLEAWHRTKGPVHINLPLSEPLYEFQDKRLPEERVISRTEGLYEAQEAALSTLFHRFNRPLIIIGQSEERIHLSDLTKRVTILAEHLANCPDALLLNDDSMDQLEALDADKSPDLVVTLGGHIINKRLKQWLRKLAQQTHSSQPSSEGVPRLQHWHVSADGAIADLFGCLTRVVEAPLCLFLRFLSSATQEATHHRLLLSEQPCGEATVVLRSAMPTLDEQAVALLIRHLPAQSVLHLANSSSVRLAQRFALPPDTDVCCNRGINGIEGCLSTAVGAAIATPLRAHFIVIGDLAFHYDINALWNDQLPANLHILLLNNHGGRIFDTLPVPKEDKAQRFIAGNAHPFRADSLCQHFGMRHFYSSSSNELDATMQDFLSCQHCCLLEIHS